MKAEFVRWTCHCEGIQFENGQQVVIKSCISDSHDPISPSLYFWNVGKKVAEPLEMSVVKKYIEDIQQLINEGNRYKEIRCLLKIKDV